jgi:hypothetical protein
MVPHLQRQSRERAMSIPGAVIAAIMMIFTPLNLLFRAAMDFGPSVGNRSCRWQSGPR